MLSLSKYLCDQKNIQLQYKLLFASIALKIFKFLGFLMPIQVKLQPTKKSAELIQRFLLSLFYFYPIYKSREQVIRKKAGNFPNLYMLYDSLSEHGLCYFYEAGDIGAFYVIYIAVFLFSVVSAGFVDSDHNLFQSGIYFFGSPVKTD